MRTVSKEDQDIKIFFNMWTLLKIIIVLPFLFMQYERTSSVEIFYIYIFYSFLIWAIIFTESKFNKMIFITHEKYKLIIFGVIRNIIVTFMILIALVIAVSTLFDLLLYDYSHYFTSSEVYGYILFLCILGTIFAFHYYEKLNFQLKIYRLGIKLKEIDININDSDMRKYKSIEKFLNKKLSHLNSQKKTIIIRIVKILSFIPRTWFIIFIVNYMLLIINLRPNTFFSFEILIYSTLISSLIVLIGSVLIYRFEDKYMNHLNRAISKQKKELLDIKNNKKYLELRNYMTYKKEISIVYGAILAIVGISIDLIPILHFLTRLISAVVVVQVVYYAYRTVFTFEDEEKSD